jgi:hypothetical protein
MSLEYETNIVFKHPVALLHFTHDNTARHNATIYCSLLEAETCCKRESESKE